MNNHEDFEEKVETVFARIDASRRDYHSSLDRLRWELPLYRQLVGLVDAVEKENQS